MPLLEELAAALSEYPTGWAPWRIRSENSQQAVAALRTLVNQQQRAAAREALMYLLSQQQGPAPGALNNITPLVQGARLHGLLSTAARREESRCYEMNRTFYEKATEGVPNPPGNLPALKLSATQEHAAFNAGQAVTTNHRRDYLWALYNLGHFPVAPIRIGDIQSTTDIPARLHPTRTRIVFRYDDRSYDTIRDAGGFLPKTRSPDEYQRSQGFHYAWHPYAYFRVRAHNAVAPLPATVRIGNLADNDTASVVSVAIAPQDALRFPLVSEQTNPQAVDQVRLYLLELPDDQDLVIDTGAILTQRRPGFERYLSGELGVIAATEATILAHCEVTRRRAELNDESEITIDAVTYNHVRNPTDVAAYAAWRAMIENRRMEFHPNGGWERYYDVHALFAPAYPAMQGSGVMLNRFFADTGPFLAMQNGTQRDAVDRYGRDCTVRRNASGFFTIVTR